MRFESPLHWVAEMPSKCLGGCCIKLKYSQEDVEQYSRSKKIDKQIEKDKRKYRREVKLLLLGAGESGKSTFLKQMKIIHGHSFDECIINEYRTTIYSNVIKGMKVLIDARNKLKISWGHDDNIVHANRVFSFDNNAILDVQRFSEYSEAIKKLWNDDGIREAYQRRREYQLSDGVRYLFDNLDRIAKDDYIPTMQDILYSRKATKGINEYSVVIKKVPFRFVDVGGQRSQRQKWFQCFEEVTSILFLVSSSEFDQVLLEDRQTNRLIESVHIFDNIVNNRCFSEISVILFLNKTDLLREKLSIMKKELDSTGSCGETGENSFQHYFPEFDKDSHKLEDVQNFILNMFEEVKRDTNKKMYHHFTTAVDTENIKFVFEDVRNTIVHKNITSLMLQ